MAIILNSPIQGKNDVPSVTGSPVGLKSYTTSGLPSASSLPVGTLVYNTDLSKVQFTDGSNWIVTSGVPAACISWTSTQSWASINAEIQAVGGVTEVIIPDDQIARTITSGSYDLRGVIFIGIGVGVFLYINDSAYLDYAATAEVSFENMYVLAQGALLTPGSVKAVRLNLRNVFFDNIGSVPNFAINTSNISSNIFNLINSSIANDGTYPVATLGAATFLSLEARGGGQAGSSALVSSTAHPLFTGVSGSQVVISCDPLNQEGMLDAFPSPISATINLVNPLSLPRYSHTGLPVVTVNTAGQLAYDSTNIDPQYSDGTKFRSLVGAGPSGPWPIPGTSVTIVYCSPSGSDTSGKGTISAPYLTVDRCLADAPRESNGRSFKVDMSAYTGVGYTAASTMALPVMNASQINVEAWNSYTPFPDQGLFERYVRADVEIFATPSLLATVVASTYTITEHTAGRTVVTVSGTPWTANEFQHKLIIFPGASEWSLCRVISNTTNTLYVAGLYSRTMLTTGDIKIYQECVVDCSATGSWIGGFESNAFGQPPFAFNGTLTIAGIRMLNGSILQPTMKKINLLGCTVDGGISGSELGFYVQSPGYSHSQATFSGCHIGGISGGGYVDHYFGSLSFDGCTMDGLQAVGCQGGPLSLSWCDGNACDSIGEGNYHTFTTYEHGYVDVQYTGWHDGIRAGIRLYNGQLGHLDTVQFDNCPYAGIWLNRGSKLIIDGPVHGTGNGATATGLGLYAVDGSSAFLTTQSLQPNLTSADVTITGTLGDMAVGGNPTRAWADWFANYPVMNEVDFADGSVVKYAGPGVTPDLAIYYVGRTADSTVTAFTFGKASSTNPNHVVPWLKTDDPFLIASVILNSASSGTKVRCVEVFGQMVPILLDGAGAATPGVPLYLSTSVDGAVSTSGTVKVGVASSSASANSTVMMLFEGKPYVSSGGTITSITAGTGLSGGTITGSGTIAIDSTVATLTGTQTLTNKSISGSANTLTNIPDSAITALSGSKVTGAVANATSAVNFTGVLSGVVSGTQGATTIANGNITAPMLASTAVTLGTYGDSTHVATFTVDQQGRITAASSVSISGLAQPTGVLTVGPTGSGATYIATGTSDQTIINSAITAAAASSLTKTVRLLPGSYYISNSITMLSGVTLEGTGQGAHIYLATGFNTSSPGIYCQGSQTTGTAITLSANAKLGDTTINVNTSSEYSAVQAGDYLYLTSSQLWEPTNANGRTIGELVRVQAVSTNSFTIYGVVRDIYNTSASASLYRLTMVQNARIRDLEISQQAALGTTSNQGLVILKYAQNCVVENNHLHDNDGPGVQVFWGLDCCVHKNNVHDLTDDVSNNRLGYGILLGGATERTLVSNNTGGRTRHFFSTGNQSSGIVRSCTVIGNTASRTTSQAFDTHNECEYLLIAGNSASDVYNGPGFTIRGRAISILSNSVDNCDNGIQLGLQTPQSQGGSASGGICANNTIQNLRADTNGYGDGIGTGISDNITICDNIIQNIDGSGIRLYEGSRRIIVRNNTVINANMVNNSYASGICLPSLSSQGAAATISAFLTPTATATGLTGITTDMVGRNIVISGAANAGNNGSFVITAYISATSVSYTNASAVFPDANSGALTWYVEATTDCLIHDNTVTNTIQSQYTLYSTVGYAKSIVIDTTGTTPNGNVRNLIYNNTGNNLTGSLIYFPNSALNTIYDNHTAGTPTFDSNQTYTLRSGVADGSTAVGLVMDSNTNWVNTNAKIVSFRNNGVEKGYIQANGGWNAGGISQITANLFYAFSPGPISVKGQGSDGATAVNVICDNNGHTFSTAGSKLLSVRNNGAGNEKFYVGYDGTISVGGQILLSRSTLAQSTATMALNFTSASQIDVTLSANVTTITLTGLTANVPCSVVLTLIQDATGSRTLAGWPATVKWMPSTYRGTTRTAPTFSTIAGRRDTIEFYWDGTNLLQTGESIGN